MGSYAHGEVFWGFDLQDLGYLRNGNYDFIGPEWAFPDEDDEDCGGFSDWAENELAKRLGWEDNAPYPSVHFDYDYGNHRESYEERAQRKVVFENTEPYKSEFAAWQASMSIKNLLVNNLGVEITTYGHCDGDSYYRVQIKQSEQSATCECTKLDFNVGSDWYGCIIRFMEILELPLPTDEPAWFVTSTFGWDHNEH